MAENKYQARLIKKLEDMFPGCIILKNDPSYKQGMLDLTILWKERWASLEVKDSETSSMRPNQEYYIERLDRMSFAAKIHPNNETEVLSALQQAFGPPRRTRLSES
jgi:hypothetical protein